ncbi:MAG: histone deacetylase family protein [Gemmatimonadales bacterium]
MQVLTGAACLSHRPAPDHPEQPERLAAVLVALRRADGITVAEAPPARRDDLLVCHERSYLERAAALARSGGGELGPDTTLSPESWPSVLAASGAALAALSAAMSRAGHQFAALRPPGHHALRGRAMGFCVVNHVAVLAHTALRRGAERVLVVDWDVHHGNGTQALVEREAAIRFVSMHQWPWYPGSGAADEVGVGNCFNVPMPAGLPSDRYVEALWTAVERATAGWRPDLILISAGYDAMRGDPLGGFTLESDDYRTWIRRLRNAFDGAPIVASLEGGYNPARLAEGVLATCQELATGG